MTPQEPICGHTYTSFAQRVFRCQAKPHTHQPDQHYFVRDTVEEAKRKTLARLKGRLVSVPGRRL